jgi:RHS repeat-associated protein
LESYTYDDGGRVVSMSRDGTTLKLGYNTADQVTAVTNGPTWVNYVHDAVGRRTVSTNSAGVIRRFLVAPTPGTDLDSPLLIANGAGTLQQGYVYLGDQPLMRYDAAGNEVYYLEDGMGSIVGLAPGNNPDAASTTRLFYDGFGNTRATNGPAPSIPTGTEGDFRFQAGWLEAGSGLYNLRAREYDVRMGRFTSRDPRNGVFDTPETLAAYAFARNNPYVYRDPSGEFSVIEVDVSMAIEQSMQTLKASAIQMVRKKIMDTLTQAITKAIVNQIRGLFPGANLLASLLDPKSAGNSFGDLMRNTICNELDIPSQFYVEVPMTEAGTPVGNGFTCGAPIDKATILSLAKLGVPRPDFVLGDKPPKSKAGGYPKTWVVGDFKIRLATLYRDYVKPSGPKKQRQFNAIVNYAAKHTYGRVSLFVVAVRGANAPTRSVLQAEFLAKAITKGSFPILVVVIGKN